MSRGRIDSDCPQLSESTSAGPQLLKMVYDGRSDLSSES